jgi:hypothetical protein
MEVCQVVVSALAKTMCGAWYNANAYTELCYVLSTAAT